MEHGFDGIYVSNHGGRSLDYDPSTLEVLAELWTRFRPSARAFRQRDSERFGHPEGACSWSKSGLPWPCDSLGMAAYGPAGVQRVLEILQAELIMAMAQTGRPISPRLIEAW